MNGRILVVDDDRAMLDLLRETLEAAGHAVTTVSSGEAAMASLAQAQPDVVLTDLRMRGMSGLDLSAQVQAAAPDVPVVVLTGFGTMSAAIDAIRAGVYDFLAKPVELEQVELSIARALQHRRLTQEVKRLRQSAASQAKGDLIGTSPAMARVYEVLPRAARSDVPVLISGETGTGKELIARALHRGSPRAEAPFVAINCAALPEALLESELFGHVKGAFTDARQARKGLFVEAGNGTLLLDEVGELPLALQPKLLRVLQEGRVRPVGADKEVPIHCRVLAATHRDLRTEAQANRFRGDLYYRLAVVRLSLPPLRERAGDVLLLAQHFLERAARRSGRTVRGLTTPVARALTAWHWPGNVRELENCIEGAVALTEHDRIVLADLPREVREGAGDTGEDPGRGPLLPLAAVERRHILRVLDACDGNKQDAARLLGIDRRTLYRKLERWDADEP
jgi:DNA-binding NtrC family response regulator